MGLLSTILGTAVDIITIPLDAISDIGDTLEGQKPKNLSGKAKKLGEDVGEAIENVTNLDLI